MFGTGRLLAAGGFSKRGGSWMRMNEQVDYRGWYWETSEKWFKVTPKTFTIFLLTCVATPVGLYFLRQNERESMEQASRRNRFIIYKEHAPHLRPSNNTDH
eukprot:TRINITY_DN25251_c0_g1_i1.p1 TRINITY_DN25251_c0_g1~~TRINITY_DN25251_c0_g1_i1.p1  ORF type:complete len:101 (-),score=5.85 TRINITY_DN25251_c0_g1_i1:54-356(-)